MKLKLNEIASIQFGLYSSDTIEEGDVKYIQAKHFDENIDLLDEIDNFLKFDEKNTSHVLKDGDILFVGKGMRNFAWVYRKEFGQAIASSIFYVIRVDSSKIIPDFLAALFNSSNYQSLFQQLGAGSSIPSIRKSELEVLFINIPAIDVQNKIVSLRKLHLEEIRLSGQIIEEKKKVYTSIINKLIAQ